MKCPYCGLDGVQKNMKKVHIKEIYLPKNAIGVNKMITETRFCIFCGKEFVLEKE